MGVNRYYLEFMFISINFTSSRNWWKKRTDRDLIFEEKRQKALEKMLGCNFIRINTGNAKNGYDLDYEVGNIEPFIDEFKNKKIKELEKKKLIEEKEMRNEKFKNKNKKLKNLTNNY